MTGSKPTEASTPAARILCAEDEALLRRDICDELTEAGYVAIEAAHGDEAMEQIDAVCPDLILCDINMPGKNGYELLAEVREQGPHLAETPFVFLTALSDPRESSKASARVPTTTSSSRWTSISCWPQWKLVSGKYAGYAKRTTMN